MTPTTFSAREVVRYSWSKTKIHLGPLVGLSLIYLGIQCLPMGIPKGIGSLVSLILSSIFYYGCLRISLQIVDGKPFAIENLWKFTLNDFLNYVATKIIYYVILIIGFILLIVPGIIWSYKYIFAVYLVVDQKMQIMDAIKKSGELTYGSKWKLFQLGLLVFGVNILGFLCLGVGLLVTFPMSWIAFAYAYRKYVPGSVVSQVY